MRSATALLASLVLGISPLTAQTTFTVTSTADPGDGVCDAVCTLREAIDAANASAATTDTIAFNITGAGPHTIAPGSALPTISDPLVIDGYTQSGASVNTNPFGQAVNATLMIVLDGSGAGDVSGLSITAAGCTVRGLVINQFDSLGIHISGAGASSNLVEGNFIGTDVTGASALGNGGHGISIDDASDNTVGGPTAAGRNVISGNGVHGVEVIFATSTGSVIQGNYIGVDASGTVDLGNGTGGVVLDEALNNTVGGTVAGAGNVISGHRLGGVMMTAATAGNLVQGNYIGTDAAGANAIPNTFGVQLDDASNNTVGGTTASARNIISGNTNVGVYVIGSLATGNVVQGNYIGPDVTGTSGVSGGVGDGVFLSDASSNTVGGTAAGAGNVISDNLNGVTLTQDADDNVFQGNYIGTTSDGLSDLGNSRNGVRISRDASDNIVGGTTAAARNVISGNGLNGVYIFPTDTQVPTGNLIQGNYIGTDATSSALLGNDGDGVLIEDSPGNTVGGTAAGAGNVIAGNTNGVTISGSGGTGNAVLSNAIFSNTALGIDLGADGVTDNDAGDGDGGANGLQNFPVFSTRLGSTIIAGTLSSTANTMFTLQFFSNGTCDGSGNGEGEMLLRTVAVTTDANGDATYADTLGVSLTKGTPITATATDASGNTSEFSMCSGVADFTVALPTDSAAGPRGGSADYTVTLDPDGGAFIGDVALSCSGLPAQAACAFAPTTASPGASGATSTLTVTTTDPGTPVGTASFTVTGTSGSVQHSAEAKLTVGDYQVSVSPTTVVAVQGSDASYTTTVTPLGGTFDEPVTLSCDNAPVGAACSFSVNPVTPGASPATSTLTVSTAAGTTPTGSSDIDVVGSSGVLGDTATATLQVTHFAMAAMPSSVKVTRGAAATYTVTVTPQDGPVDDPVTLSCTGLPAQASCVFAPSSVTPGASSTTATVTVSTATGTPTGSADFTIVGAVGSLEGGAAATLVVTDFTVAVSPSSATVTGGQSATYTVTVSPDGGSFGESVSLACSGLPTGGSCSFSPSSVTPGGSAETSTLTVSTSSVAQMSIVPSWGGSAIRVGVLALLSLALAGLGLAVVRQAPRGGRRRWALVSGAALGLALLVGACDGEPTGPSSQTHTITVTGTAGLLEHSATMTLTVQ